MELKFWWFKKAKESQKRKERKSKVMRLYMELVRHLYGWWQMPTNYIWRKQTKGISGISWGMKRVLCLVNQLFFLGGCGGLSRAHAIVRWSTKGSKTRERRMHMESTCSRERGVYLWWEREGDCMWEIKRQWSSMNCIPCSAHSLHATTSFLHLSLLRPFIVIFINNNFHFQIFMFGLITFKSNSMSSLPWTSLNLVTC